MKKNFKRIICTALALCLLCALAVTAMAAAPAPTSDGVYNVTGKLDPKTAANADITAQTANIDGKDVEFYPGAERFALQATAEAGKQHLVFLLKGTEAVPTKNNIFYIDQNGTATFDLFPMQMSAGDYTVWMTVSNGGAPVQQGSFTYHQSYVLGDVDGNTLINTDDALLALRHAVKQITLEGNALLAANVTAPRDNDNVVNTDDALLILRKAVKQIENFG